MRKTGRFTAKACWLSLGLKRVLEVSVAALGEWRGDGWVWVFNWRWTLLQREEIQQKLVKLEGCFEEWQQHFRGDLFQLLVLVLPFR
ncbi:hypothetical protein Ancab_035554 [Ancistrocladus abbreviatus]